MTVRREYGVVLLACALGAGLLFLAGSRGWVTLSVARGKPLPELRHTVSGSKAQPLITAMAVLGLAGVVALLATRRVGRRIVGLLLAIAAVLTVIWLGRDLHGMSAGRAESLLSDAGPVVGVPAGARVTVDLHLSTVALGLAGVLLLALAGGWAAVRGRVWPAMGSRYDRPAEQTTPDAGRTDDITHSGSPADGTDATARSGDTESADPAATGPPAAQRLLWEALDRGEDPTAIEESSNRQTNADVPKRS